MGKTIRIFTIILCASLAFGATACKDDAKKFGDENGQILCPVMENKIDRSVYVDHNGKRVYFCCKGCIEDFKKDPEKYMKKLEGVKLDEAPGGESGK